MVVLIRPGELTIKGHKTRARFEELLVRNMGEALSSVNLRHGIRREPGRFFAYTDDDLKAVEVLKRVFGIKSLSVAREIRFKTLGELVERAARYFKEKVRGKKFAVRARRAGKHDFTSMDIARELGSALLPFSSGVDLKKPDVEVFVEVRGLRAYLYTDVVEAYGGLPLGSEGRVVALVSGGFDSPVAAWYMLRRGAYVDYVFCNLGGAAYEAAVLSVVKVLADKWSYGYRPRMFVLDFAPLLKELRERTDISLINVLLKRYMYRAAEAIALRIGAEGIVTGESLGQVASQTLRNLYVSSLAVSMPIYRPLIGMDKDDIVKMAKEIGTYDLSALVKEYCGSFAEHPRTHANVEEVEREEAKIDRSILTEILRGVREIDLKSLTAPKTYRELEISEIPSDAVVIDLRAPSKFKAWHLEGALNIDFLALPSELPRLNKNKKYVLVCDEGALSLEAARIMREAGFEAYSYKGGVRRLKRKSS